MPHKKRKSRKQRGSRQCGWGQVGQHRGGGMRGGKGRAGGRKHFWIRTVKYEPGRYQKKGFTPPSALEPTPEVINVGDLKELLFNTMGVEGLRDGTGLDLTAMGFDKLLGRGKVDMALDVRVSSCSSSALDKIESAGGSIIEE